MTPRVSVILPVYNAGPYLRQAIESVLNQTFTDFELIIINDGSTDDSRSVIASFHDQRIHHIEQDNLGLRATLNTAIDLSRGEFIARMDNDDISLPDRLRQQVEFLTAHPDHALVGTTFAYINNTGEVTGVFPALLENEELQREVLTQSPFGHGTVMFRAATLNQGKFRYSPEAVHIEDYELWLRLSQAVKIANLPDVLYLWRHYPASTSGQYAPMQERQKKELQGLAVRAGRTTGAAAWPGWRQLHHYSNENITVQGRSLRLERRNAHCLMYLNLARLFIRHGQFWPALKTVCYSLLIQPFFPASLLRSRLFHRHENLFCQ